MRALIGTADIAHRREAAIEHPAEHRCRARTRGAVLDDAGRFDDALGAFPAGSHPRAEQLARHMLAYGRPLTVAELMTRIDAVSVESTRNVARGLLSRSRPAVVALGSGRGLDTAVGFAEGLTRSKAKTLLH